MLVIGAVGGYRFRDGSCHAATFAAENQTLRTRLAVAEQGRKDAAEESERLRHMHIEIEAKVAPLLVRVPQVVAANPVCDLSKPAVDLINEARK